MIINATQYSSPCACGISHRVTTRLAVIEAGCLAEFDHYAQEMGLEGRRAAIYDENTYHANGLHRPRAEQEIILPAANLLADERSAHETLSALRADTQVLIAIGGGTVHDIVRFCAERLGLPFIACPTAASGGGYASNRCAMVSRGIRRVLPSIAPTLVLADVNVLTAAPRHMVRGGIGEALANYTALADWRVAQLLTHEPLCPTAEALAVQAAVAAQGCCGRFARDDGEAVAQLMYALVLSGLSAQVLGERHPATGAEHHLCHLMELLPVDGQSPDIPYGERLGAATVAIAALYQHACAMRNGKPPIVRSSADLKWLVDRLGEQLANTLLAENEPDCLSFIDSDPAAVRWDEIRRVVADMPPAETLARLLQQGHDNTSPIISAISQERLPELLEVAAYTANQPTLLRLLHRLSIPYEQSADASFAPSRSKRYAESAMTRAGNRNAVSASFIR